MSLKRAVKINENHRRRITTTLTLLDESLCTFEELARGREFHSVLYAERNSLTADQRRALLHEIATMRSLLKSLRKELHLAP